MQKSLEKEMSSCSVKATVCINKDKLHGELQDLRAQREKVIEERKQFDVELKGLNMQVQKKVSFMSKTVDTPRSDGFIQYIRCLVKNICMCSLSQVIISYLSCGTKGVYI